MSSASGVGGRSLPLRVRRAGAPCARGPRGCGDLRLGGRGLGSGQGRVWVSKAAASAARASRSCSASSRRTSAMAGSSRRRDCSGCFVCRVFAVSSSGARPCVVLGFGLWLWWKSGFRLVFRRRAQVCSPSAFGCVLGAVPRDGLFDGFGDSARSGSARDVGCGDGGFETKCPHSSSTAHPGRFPG